MSEFQTQKRYLKGTHESDQSDSESTNLLDNALRRAIMPRRHDPIVSPPNIEHTSHGLQKVEYKKGELSRKFNELSGRARDGRKKC